MELGCLEHNSYDIIDTDNCIIFNKLQNFYFQIFYLVYSFGLTVEPNIDKILFESQNILIVIGIL